MIPPLLILTIFYITGIIVADCYGINVTTAIYLLVIAAISHIIVLHKKEVLRAVSAALVFLFLGILLTALLASRLESGVLCKAAKQGSYVIVDGTLLGDPSYRDNTARFDIKARRILAGGKEWEVHENLRVRVRSGRLNLYMGKAIRVSGHLELARADGDFNYRRYLYHRGIMAVLTASPENIENGRDSRFSLASFTGSIRHWVKGKNMANLPKQQAGLLNGIVLGDTASIDEELEESFRATGLTHILAASGMNIALILGALWPLLHILRLRPGIQVAVLLVFTALYTMVSGMSPSITRAFLMAAIGLMAWLSGRAKNNLTSLSAAGLVLLVVDPFTLYDIGFQLSFAATASLIIFAPILEGMMEDIPASLRSGLSVTLAAQVGVLPLMVYYFGQVSAISVLANIIVVPLTAPALIVGMVVLPLEALSHTIAIPLYLFLRVVLGIIILETKCLSSAPGASLLLSQPSLIAVAVCYLIIAAIGIYLHRVKLKLRLSHIIISLIGVLALSIWWQVGIPMGPSRLEVSFLNVGQGDSALVCTPDGMTMIIDGGPDPTLIKRKLTEKGVKKIDALVISHDHADHAGGVKGLLDSFKVGSFIYPSSISTSRCCSSLISCAKQRGVGCMPLGDGDVVHLGKLLEVDALCTNVAGASAVNDDSAVVMLKYGGFKALFTGDAGFEAERKLINDKKMVDADVLKVGHHGSASSSTQDFLQEVTPKVSVISVGKGNMYGHPSRSAIHRLQEAGSKIYRTDNNGDVTINSDGKTFEVYTEK